MKKSKKHPFIIPIIGTIDDDMYKQFSEYLLNAEAQGYKEVTIDLSSHGGVAFCGLAIVSKMRLSNIVFHVRAYGLVASSAVIILAAGDTRHVSAETWVMVHESQSKIKGPTTTLVSEADTMLRQEKQWNMLMAKYTKLTARQWAVLHKNTTYFSAKQCLLAGLADEVV